MSVIGSVGGSSLDLYQILQQSALQQNTQVESGAARGEPPSEEQRSEWLEHLAESVAESADLDAEAAADLQEQLEAAVTAALEETDDSSDPRQAVDDAIRGVLEENGLDPEEYMPERPEPPPMNGASGAGGLLSSLTYYSSGTTDETQSLMNFLQLLDVEG